MSNQFSSPSTSPTDLLRRAQNGDQVAFEELLDRYAPLIDSMIRQFSALPSFSVQDREDLRQEAIVAFYCALMRFNTDQQQVQFGLYAKECIRNRLISHLRTLKKHEQVLSLEEDEASASDSAQDTDPTRQLVEEENYLTLCRQVSGILSEYENRIWWLYLAGRTAGEVAALIGTNEKSVQNAVYRIRKKLRSGLPYS
ncbi:MAG: sigma-70 family RNA polymerase sigma factor [Clostridia bacterium]|nr:sigma-70 family RNA polymerase sigma factor [Clostridia bacterium]